MEMRRSSALMRVVQIFLLVLIIIGIVLLCTQSMWVPPLVQAIIQSENATGKVSEVSPSTSTMLASAANATSTASTAGNSGASTAAASTLPTGSPWLTTLPLGDYKYVTSAPKKGYVYLCNVAPGGQGAQVAGPWIQGSVWYPSQKIAVEGNVSWPNASIKITLDGLYRDIVTNDLPVGLTTGIFPISSSDPAYKYDSNPNSIEAQNISVSLPANPTVASAPSCIYGEVGIMTNGVLLLDAFDAEYRDAEAHEILDSCDGHAHEGGMYHYHGLSACLTDIDETNILGWAFDGFPITGPKLPNGNYLTTADLDECHGITSPIIENGKTVTTYHYVMTEDFPYTVGCFRGKSYEPKPSMQGGMAGMGGGSGSETGAAGGAGEMPGMNGMPPPGFGPP